MSDRKNLIETLGDEERWSVFLRLLKTTGADEWIKLDDQFTVFAPTNDAFDNFTSDKLDELISEPNQAALKMLLSYHFMPGKLHSDDLTSNPPRKAITGVELIFTDNAGLQVNGANIRSSNLQASNGVIHEVDTVLAPPMQTAVKSTSPLEPAKTVSAAPITLQIEATAANSPALRKSSTIF